MALKDLTGKAILVGSTVAFALRHGTRALLRKGIVTGTSEGTTSNLGGSTSSVFIRTDGDKDISRDPEQVAVVAGDAKSGGPAAPAPKGKAPK